MDVDKDIKINKGLIALIILSVIPMFAWKFGYELNQDTAWEAIALSLAKIGAFGGMAMFALSLILSGRYKFLDSLFSGLDKVYIAHRFLGSFSLVLLLIHPVSLSLLVLDQGWQTSLGLWFKVSDFSVWIGGIALYLLVAIVVWSIYRKSKYETFVKVHRTLGLIFLLGALHAFMSGSILGDNPFMFWYLFILSALATYTFVTYSVFGDIFHRPARYTVESIEKHHSNILNLKLAPEHRIINFYPGQFVYVSFEGLEEHGYHPFSVASRRQSANLELALRIVGDFTESLQSIKTGTKVKVKGPYGKFILELKNNTKQLWIAGGIGITPFLSGAESLQLSRKQHRNDIELIYTSDDNDPFGLERLQSIEDKNNTFNVTHYSSDTFGFVSFKTLKEQIVDFDEREIYICGPPVMLANLKKEAQEGGFEDRLNYEEFSY